MRVSGSSANTSDRNRPTQVNKNPSRACLKDLGFGQECKTKGKAADQSVPCLV